MNDIHAVFGDNKTTLSERTLNDYVSNIMLPRVPEDETALVSFVKDHAEVLKSMNGQLLHEVKNGVLEGLKNVKPAEPDVPAPAAPAAKPVEGDANAALLAKIEQMELNLSELAKANQLTSDKDKVSNLMTQARAEMKNRNASHDFSLKQTERFLTVSPDMEVNDVVAAWENEYNAFYKQLNSEGIEPLQGGGDFSGKAASKILGDFKADLISKGQIPKAE